MKRTALSLFIGLFLLIGSAQSQQWGDYILYSIQNSSDAYLLDTNRVIAHTWTFPTTAKTGYSSYLMPGGILWRSVAITGNSFTGGPICGKVQKVDYSGTVLWDYTYSTTAYCTHHDIHPMPNGNVLLIAYERKTAAEVAAAGCSTFSQEMWPDKIVEVQPTGATTGTIVWEWHAWDHLVQSTNANGANYQTSVVNHPELLNINYNAQKDWMHMNGVAYNPILDQVIFSCHNLNEMYIIDHSTTTAEAASHSGGNSGKGGDILYRWGNPAAYGASGTQILKVVHDAHWNPEGVPNAGYIAGYNNQGISTNASSCDQVQTPINGYNYTLTAGQAYAPASYTLRQASGGFNSNMGSFQVQPNGNILVNMGVSGVIKEFNSAGTQLWTKTLTGFNAKAFKYSACYVDNAAPAIPTIAQNGAALSSTAATTYQWYMNGQLIPGATSQNFTPTADGVYVVRITDSNGCYNQYSAGFDYDLTIGMDENAATTGLSIYPNPSTGIFTMDISWFQGDDFEYSVIDMHGRLVAQKRNSGTIDLSDAPSGIYSVVVNSTALGATSRRIVLNR